MDNIITTIPNNYYIKHTEIYLKSACDYVDPYFTIDDQSLSLMSNLSSFVSYMSY